MIALPKWLTRGPVWSLGLYSVAFAVIAGRWGTHPVVDAAALGLFVAGFVLMAVVRPEPPRWVEPVLIAVAVALPILATWDADPRAGSYSTGGWYISAVGCLGVGLLILRRARSTWIVFAVLVVHTVLWAGPQGLVGYGVVALVLLVAVGAVAAWALTQTEAGMTRFHDAERETVTWRAAQDAYHAERQVRLARVNRTGSAMLRRIVDERGRLTEEDRLECRILEQTIRDEVRGRRLLHDGVRDAALAARRRGAVVQIIDDGGLDDLPAAALEPLLDRVAESIAAVTSNRIIVRTGRRDSGVALSVVATTVDPTAAALGLDDEEEVDLWLELDRPAPIA